MSIGGQDTDSRNGPPMTTATEASRTESQERLALRPFIRSHAATLSETLARHRLQSFPPEASKAFRRLWPGEVAGLLDVSESTLRQVAVDENIGRAHSNRRSYTVQDLAKLRGIFEERTPGRYVPRRKQGEHLQIIVVMNFKGGSAKTTTCAHLLQYLALRGYRSLAVDLDPQASLTALFGIHSVADLKQGETIYGAIRYAGDRTAFRDTIRPTYIPDLFLSPGGLELVEFEHEAPRVLMDKAIGRRFFGRLQETIASVGDEFDVVVIDCPPQLGFLTITALVAATSVLVTVHPQMLDVMSMSQFLTMTSELLDTVATAAGNVDPVYDWMRYLITRFEPNDGPQNQMSGLLRAQFGQAVLNHPVLKSTAISDAGLTNQTVYEVERTQFIRSTYDRAMESVNAANNEIEKLILAAWGRPVSGRGSGGRS